MEAHASLICPKHGSQDISRDQYEAQTNLMLVAALARTRRQPHWSCPTKRCRMPTDFDAARWNKLHPRGAV